MAGKFNLREIESLFLDSNPTLPETTPAGVGIVAYDGNQATLTLTYLNQSQNSTTTSMARGEVTVLAQNILQGVPVTAIGPQMLVGAVYLPDGIVDLSSDSVLQVTEQAAGPATMTVTVRSLLNPQVVVANYAITLQAGPGSSQAVALTTQSGSTSGGGWFEILASVDSPTAQGLIGGIRLVINPTP